MLVWFFGILSLLLLPVLLSNIDVEKMYKDAGQTFEEYFAKDVDDEVDDGVDMLGDGVDIPGDLQNLDLSTIGKLYIENLDKYMLPTFVKAGISIQKFLLCSYIFAVLVVLVLTGWMFYLTAINKDDKQDGDEREYLFEYRKSVLEALNKY